MSPGVDDLEWAERKDFTAGLWERGNDRECPENGLLELTDAYSLQTGGLRAAQRFTTLSGSINTTASEYMIGPWWIANPEGLYFIRFNPSTDAVSFRKFTTTPPPFTSSAHTELFAWASVDTLDGGIQLTSFRTDAVGYRGYFNFPAVLTLGSTAGIWRTDGSTVTFTFAATRPQGCIAHQARLHTLTDDQGINDKIIYTEPASHAAPSTANFIRPGGEQYGGYIFLSAIQPSDLLTLKYGKGLWLIQGEVTNPLERELTFVHNTGYQFPVTTDDGLVLVVPDDSVYLWTGGRLEDIGANFQGTPMLPSTIIGGTDNGRTNRGHMGHAGHFVYAGRDYVWDKRTRAWFRLSTLTQSGMQAHTFTTGYATGSNDNPWIIAGLSNDAGTMSTTMANIVEAAADEDEMARARSYTFTLPLMQQVFFQTSLRAVEYYIESYTDECAVTLEVIYPQLESGHSEVEVTKTFETVRLQGIRPHKVRMNVGPIHSDWVKIRTTIAGDNQGEAPMLEKVLIGHAPGTRYSVDN